MADVRIQNSEYEFCIQASRFKVGDADYADSANQRRSLIVPRTFLARTKARLFAAVKESCQQQEQSAESAASA